MLRRTSQVLLETARARAALSSKTAGAFDVLASLASSSTSTSSTSYFAASAASSSFFRRALQPKAAASAAGEATASTSASYPSAPCRRSFWNDGYQRFGDQPRRGGGGGRGGRGGGYQQQQQQDPRSTFRARPRLASLLGGATLAAGGVVYYTSRETIPYTLRNHSILVSQDLERSLGEATFAQIVQDAKARRALLPRNHPSVRAVERIGRRLASVAADGGGGGASSHMERLDWEFVVVDDPGNVNAMVAPGGKVVVYTGLLRILQSEKELAAVLAHEVAHILARHTAEKLTSMQAASLARMILYWAFGIPLPLGALELALFLPNSRAAETEADVIGVRLAARACYDPSAAATVFEKLGEAERRAGGDGIPAFMRTHPLSDRRVKRVRAELPAAMLLYEKAGCSLPRSALRQFVNVLTGEEEEVEIAGVKGRGGRGTEGDVGDDDDPLARLFK